MRLLNQWFKRLGTNLRLFNVSWLEVAGWLAALAENATQIMRASRVFIGKFSTKFLLRVNAQCANIENDENEWKNKK